jgi:cytochrome b6-f complex subunit 5
LLQYNYIQNIIHVYKFNKNKKMVEPLLSGIVLGMITVSALGLFVAAFLQYRRGNQFEV